MWVVVKKVKTETLEAKPCGRGNIYEENQYQYDPNSPRPQVEIVENHLGLKLTREQQFQFDNMTLSELKDAAEMYIYLISCPFHKNQWFKSWAVFFRDLFATQFPDQIILTLNRLMKTSSSDEKVLVEKLFQKSVKLLSLKFGEIQRLLPTQNYESPKGVNSTFNLTKLHGMYFITKLFKASLKMEKFFDIKYQLFYRLI